jgi:hypothetical protein
VTAALNQGHNQRRENDMQPRHGGLITGRIAGEYWLSHIPVNGAAVPPLRSHVNLYKSVFPNTVLGTPGNGSGAGGSPGFSR